MSASKILPPPLDPTVYGPTPSPKQVTADVSTATVQVVDRTNPCATKTLPTAAALDIFETGDAFVRAWNGSTDPTGKVARAPNIDAVMALTTPDFQLHLHIAPLVPGGPTELDRAAAKATWAQEIAYGATHDLAINHVTFLSKDVVEVKERFFTTLPNVQGSIALNGVVQYRRVAEPAPGKLSWLISDINVYADDPTPTPAPAATTAK